MKRNGDDLTNPDKVKADQRVLSSLQSGLVEYRRLQTGTKSLALFSLQQIQCFFVLGQQTNSMWVCVLSFVFSTHHHSLQFINW
jgi:hypothetical protein